MSFARCLLIGLCCLACSARALARVERFALIAGNDRGAPGELELRYAEADARKVADVLRELGGVEPANTALLLGGDADTLRRTLIALNDRIRAAVAQPGTDVVLFVYYSGHADAEALHLGRTRLQTNELAQLVRGSAATFRLMVLDACRSGKLTRSKGGKIRPPFALDNEAQLPGQGLAFLTASAADEDAQESDELKSSFFTHALVSGLLGAADHDGDGSVVLDEAYRYAYDATLRATSRTAFGTQHPTFQYDLRGQGRLVLTELRREHEARGTLSFDAGLDALVLRDSANGAMLAELVADSPARSLSLAPGKYFVRVRGDAYLLEGAVNVRAAQTTHVDTAQLKRFEYARLVRKGAQERAVHGIELGGQLHGALPNAERPCYGALLGYRVDFRRALLSTRASYCQSRFGNHALDARVHELTLGLRAGHAWDLSFVSLELGAGAFASLFIQRFEALGYAPARRTMAGHASLYLALLHTTRGGVYLGAEIEGQLHVLSLRDQDGGSALRAAPTFGCALLVGKHF